jgi:hypothetical protein
MKSFTSTVNETALRISNFSNLFDFEMGMLNFPKPAKTSSDAHTLLALSRMQLLKA